MSNKRINNLLYNLFIVCICFEEMFGKTNLPLTSLKYIVSLFLLARVLSSRKKLLNIRINYGILAFYFFLTLYFFVSLEDFVTYGLDGFHIWRRFFWLPIFFYVTVNSSRISSFSQTDLMRKYVYGIGIYCILNFFFYFYELPIWKVWHPYWGRITVGYPTTDVVLICFSLIMLYFNSQISVGYVKKVLLTLVFVVSLLSQASGTGFFLFVIFVLMFVPYFLYSGGAKSIRSSRKALLTVFLILTVSIGSLFVYLQKEDPELFNGISMQLENRVNIILGREELSELSVNTMEIRNQEYEHAQMEVMSTDMVYNLLGGGFGLLTSDSQNRFVKVYMEDQYHIFRISIGLIGTLLFYIVVVWMSAKGLLKRRLWRHDKLDAYLYLLTTIYILSSSFTSGCMGSVGICGALSIICAYYYVLFRKVEFLSHRNKKRG